MIEKKNNGTARGANDRRPVTSELLDQMPPSNLDAEKGVLGSLLLDTRLCDDVALILRPEDFYSDANEKLYTHILEMHSDGKRVDPTLLLERLQKKGDLVAVGGAAYIAEVMQSVPYSANAEHYARIVRDKAILRELIYAGTEIIREAYHSSADTRELSGKAEELVFSANDRGLSSSAVASSDLMIEAFDRIDARMENKTSSGVPTGFVDLDGLTGGLHDSEFVVLAARPSMGKSALAANIAEHAAIVCEVPTLFVSLEMARIELAQRMLCSQGHIDANKFRSGFLSKDDRSALVEVSARIGKSPLFIDDTPSRTCTEIAALTRRMKRKNNIGLLIVDYLQLIQPDDPREVRQEQVAKMSRRMKAIARELKIPVLCVAQLNRQTEQGGSHRPKLSQLRESGAIEQDADVVMFVHREEYYCTREEAREKGVAGQADIVVAKQRSGPVGDVKVAWFANELRFESLSGKQQNGAYEEFQEFSSDF